MSPAKYGTGWVIGIRALSSTPSLRNGAQCFPCGTPSCTAERNTE